MVREKIGPVANLKLAIVIKKDYQKQYIHLSKILRS